MRRQWYTDAFRVTLDKSLKFLWDTVIPLPGRTWFYAILAEQFSLLSA